MPSDLPARSVGPADAECARCREALAEFDGLCSSCNDELNDEIGDREMERGRDDADRAWESARDAERDDRAAGLID